MRLRRYRPVLSASSLGLALSILLCFAAPALARRENRTIDDQSGDAVTGALPVYAPADKWSYGPSCSGCLVKPDAGQAYRGTWHDATVGPDDVRNVTFSFTGSAIYIFCIVPNYVQYATTSVNLTFAIDGKQVGRYNHTPSASTDYEYNILVYQNENLSNDQHQFVLTPTGGPGKNESLVLFDYAIYTHDDEAASSLASSSASLTRSSSASPTSSLAPSPSPKPSNVGAIAGGIGGGVGALLLAGLLAFFCLRRRRAARHAAYLSGDKPDVLGAEDVVDPAYRPQPYFVPATASSVHSLPAHSAGVPLSALRSPTTLGGSSDYRYDALASNPVDGEFSRLDLTHPPGAIAPSDAGTATSSGTSSKAAMRQAALERQLWEVQQRIDALPPSNGGGSSSGGGPSIYAPTSVGGGEADGESAAALRVQVDALRAEVERLRAGSAGVELYGAEAPPAYDGRRAEGQVGGGSASGAQPHGKEAWLAAQNLSPSDVER